MFLESEQQAGGLASPRIKVRMLQQMAEALEDEAGSLSHRVAVFEEEEQSLAREIEDRQTEINRLAMKLESIRSDRRALMAKAQAMRAEAAAMREEVFNSEEELALHSLEITPIDADCSQEEREIANDDCSGGRDLVFFRRMTLNQEAR